MWLNGSWRDPPLSVACTVKVLQLNIAKIRTKNIVHCDMQYLRTKNYNT